MEECSRTYESPSAPYCPVQPGGRNRERPLASQMARPLLCPSSVIGNSEAAMNDQPEPLVRAMRERMEGLVFDLRSDIGRMEDPQFKALFETAAEVMIGLSKAFRDFEKKEEPAWRKLSRSILP